VIAAWTSWAAESMLRSSSNWMVIEVPLRALIEVSCVTPGICPN